MLVASLIHFTVMDADILFIQYCVDDAKDSGKAEGVDYTEDWQEEDDLGNSSFHNLK